MSLIAKPILKNQLWVVTDGSNKVGNVEFTPNGYNVKLGNRESYFDSTKTIEQMASIEFQNPVKVSNKKLPYAVWPTTKKTYNNMFDVKRKLHVFTKLQKSKCYYAAGWFKVQIGDSWQTIFCPKYIFIQRYKYQGPFMSVSEAEAA